MASPPAPLRCAFPLTLGLVVSLGPGIGACSSEPENPLEAVEGLSSLYEHMGRRSVVRVGLPGAEGTASDRAAATGKGVALGDGTWILTGAHLALGTDELELSDVDDNRLKARVVSVDTEHGLALLRLERGRVAAARLELETIPASGDDVYLMVEDEFVGFAPAYGYIAGRREVPAGDLLRLSAFASPSEYGGPVFGPKGTLVGLIIPDQLVDREVNASYAQPVPALLAFLRAAGGPQR